MVEAPAPAVDLNAVIATKADLEGLATKADVAEVKAEMAGVRAAIDELAETLTSSFNLMMGELGKVKANQEEMRGTLAKAVGTLESHGTILAKAVARGDGVDRGE